MYLAGTTCVSCAEMASSGDDDLKELQALDIDGDEYNVWRDFRCVPTTGCPSPLNISTP